MNSHANSFKKNFGLISKMTQIARPRADHLVGRQFTLGPWGHFNHEIIMHMVVKNVMHKYLSFVSLASWINKLNNNC